MDLPASFDSRLTARGVIGAVIIAFHVALGLMLARATILREAESTAPALLIDLLDREVPARELPPMAPPQFVPVQAVTIPPPDVVVPIEKEPTAITSSFIPQPTLAPPPSGSGTEPPSMSDVAYLRQPLPHYPPESRRAHEEGLVVLRVLIDALGHACSIEVYRSSGHPRLDEAARNAVERALFKPYLDRGTARSAQAMIPVEFSLRGRS